MEANITTLSDLAIDHDFYSSESNYYSNDAKGNWTTFADFYEQFHDADIDMNLIFRWDIRKREGSGRYSADIFMILQRKGIYMPHRIEYIDESDIPKFKELMLKHWEKLNSIWKPLS